MVIDHPVGYLASPMLHRDRRGLDHFYAKHNRYSTLEAVELYNEVRGVNNDEPRANLPDDARRRRWLKRNVMQWLPWPGLWRFAYMFFARRGFLDGVAGYRFCMFIAAYDSMVAMKLRARLADLRTGEDSGHKPTSPSSESSFGKPTSLGLAPLTDETFRRDGSASATETLIQEQTKLLEIHPEASPWSLRGKLARALWMLIGEPLFRFSFHNWYGYRNLILRLCGAKVGKRVTIRPTVKIEVPWHVVIEDGVTIGDGAIIYSLGLITIKRMSIISQYAHLCAGTHDYTDRTFKLLRQPITIGANVWIGADAFIGPDVNVGDYCVVGARSSAYADLPSWKVCVGNPARAIKSRVMSDVEQHRRDPSDMVASTTKHLDPKTTSEERGST